MTAKGGQPVTEPSKEFMEKLLARLDEITEVRVQVGIMSSQLNTAIEQQKTLYSAIKGNGTPGLEERVRFLELVQNNRETTCPLRQRLSELEHFRSEAEENQEQAEEKAEEHAKEWRVMRIGLISSIIMLIFSTLARIFLP